MSEIDFTLAERISKLTGSEIFRCYQCQKCSSGCPVGDEMDLLPAQVIRLVQLGYKDKILSSKTIWVCASCETCTTRCPNEIDIAMVMDSMREECLESGHSPAFMDVIHFHKSFLSSIESFGRVHELDMIGKYKLKSKKYFDDMRLGFEMFRRGKIKLFPHKIKGRKEIRKIFLECGDR